LSTRRFRLNWCLSDDLIPRARELQTQKDIAVLGTPRHIMAEVRIVLSTKEPDLQLPEETGAILLQTSVRRNALSTLVNHLLEQTESPIPFEFLINGRFLRTTIDEYLTANGISSEEILSLEYVRAVVPPTHVTSFQHDDWVSSVDVLSNTAPAAAWSGKGDIQIQPEQRRIVSGSYDGLLRVWSANTSELLATSPSMGSPAQAIKSVKFLSPSRIVSSGNDRVLRVWKYDEANSYIPNGQSALISPIVELYGHKASVDSIAVHAPSSRILSASSDQTIGLWSTRTSDAPPVPESLLPGAASQSANKRRKLNAAGNVAQRGPLNILHGHSGPVSAAAFSLKDHTVGYSASWDHTVVTWDLVTGQAVSTRRTMHPLLCLTEQKDLGLLVVGTSARHLLAVDPREDARNVAGMTLRGHTGAVVSAGTESFGRNGQSQNSWGLVSGSHDGTCRVWDLRSVSSDSGGVGMSNQVCESTHVIKRESLGTKEKRVVAGDGIKVFGVCWDSEVGIVSCGEDKRVQINQSSS
jgi:WD40 repeat protein